jgi:hypothetical protein
VEAKPQLHHATGHYLLDALDGFLIAAIQEVEELRSSEVDPSTLEQELARLWKNTYAYASAQAEEHLQRIWITRGRSIKVHYPDRTQRRRIYKTSLTPRSATVLLAIADEVKSLLAPGADYMLWDQENRFAYVRKVISALSQVTAFEVSTNLGRRRNFTDWPKLLRWWLAKSTLPTQPTAQEITTWYDFVAKNFIYKGAWGLGSIIGLLMDNVLEGGPVRALELEDWPRSGMPWSAFWLKELITWGTLEPVAAFLLARGDAIDRPQAELDASEYYLQLPAGTNPNDALDPRRIGDWVSRRASTSTRGQGLETLNLAATLVRPASEFLDETLTVTPLDSADGLLWIDPAGHLVASTQKPKDWPMATSSFGFDLRVDDALIVGEAYRPYI